MKKKNKILIIVLVSLIINVFFIAFLIVPTFMQISKTSKVLFSMKKELATIQAEIANFKNFKTYHKLYLQNLKEMDNLVKNQLFVNKELPIEIVSFCQEEAKRENLTLEITPLPPKEEEKTPFDYIFLKIKLRGEFPSFLRFLKRIENSQWLVETQRVIISSQKEGLEIDLLIKAYAQSPN
ncbi:MAG: hypothetical protein LR000_01645 [Candidatus Pacebacteria bacterium]|nr:hypothetical protein [Candidatus Paceibacterota bacterium]